VAAEPEFFVANEAGVTTGPLSPAELRVALRDRTSPPVKVRFASASTWLPIFVVDAAGSHGAPPAPPPMPKKGPSATLPPALVEITPKMREHLLWFVLDVDGMLGPVTGEFIRRGLAAGKITPSASLCMVTSTDWIRALSAFPKVIEGTTKVFARPDLGAGCPSCREPILKGEPVCPFCAEPLASYSAHANLSLAAILALSLAMLFVIGLVGAAYLRGRVDWARRRFAPAATASASASGMAASPLSLPILATLAPSAHAASATTPVPGHLVGELGGKIDVAPDSIDALPLAHHRVAVARKAVVDVLDDKSGALIATAADVPALRALTLVGDAVYGAGDGRLAIIDPESFHPRRVLLLGASPGPIAQSSPDGAPPLALITLESERAVAVIDAQRSAEIERFRFDDRVTSVSVEDSGDLAVAVPADARGVRPGDDAIVVFEPRRLAAGQLVRRIQIGPGPSAAVLPGKGVAVVTLLGAGEIARVDLVDRTGAAPDKRVTARQTTCAEPALLRPAAASGLLLVGCSAGHAVALHDAASLARIAQIEFGGPVVGLEVAPDGLQALVVTGAPLAAVTLVDLASRTASRVAIKDEITSAHYGRSGTVAAALSTRAHHAWVLR
jgi:hypothetical protein